jgi:hypothetical protein
MSGRDVLRCGPDVNVPTYNLPRMPARTWWLPSPSGAVVTQTRACPSVWLHLADTSSAANASSDAALKSAKTYRATRRIRADIVA